MKIGGTNFLDILQPKRAEKRRKLLFIRIIFYIFAGIVAVSLIISAFYFWMVQDVYRLADSGKTNLELAAGRVESLEFGSANEYLSEAEENFLEAQKKFGTLRPLEIIPWVGDQYVAVSGLIETGFQTASALKDITGVLEEIMNVAAEAGTVVGGMPSLEGGTSFAQIPADKKREILRKLQESIPELQGAGEKIDKAFSALGEIKEEKTIPQIASVLGVVRETLTKLKATINKTIPVAEILPYIAGYPDERTYLFLLQNSDEMRPTGGFIGTYGIVKARDGEVETFDTENIYVLDGPATYFLKVDPPAPIKKYLKVGAWFMRDSNWSPDFPTSAEKAEWFYHAERGPEKKIDAVIAVTPDFIENILRQIGNVEADGQTFTPENLMEVLQYKVEKEYYEKGIPEARRKDIVGKLGEKIFERLANLPSSKWGSLLEVTSQALSERHLMLWGKDSRLQNIIVREGWDGGVRSFDGDFLMVVDANLAALKTDSVVDRQINYSFAPGSDGKLRAKVSVKYKNNGSFTWKTTRYRTYTRIYVPQGSIFVKGSGMMENDKISDPARRPGKVDVGEELGKTYFGAFISIEPGEERTLSFEYVLPDKIKNQLDSGSYKLLAQKQAGTLAHPLTLNLDFGKNVKQAVPAEEPKEWGNTVYKLETNLRLDKEIEVKF